MKRPTLYRRLLLFSILIGGASVLLSAMGYRGLESVLLIGKNSTRWSTDDHLQNNYAKRLAFHHRTFVENVTGAPSLLSLMPSLPCTYAHYHWAGKLELRLSQDKRFAFTESTNNPAFAGANGTYMITGKEILLRFDAGNGFGPHKKKLPEALVPVQLGGALSLVLSTHMPYLAHYSFLDRDARSSHPMNPFWYLCGPPEKGRSGTVVPEAWIQRIRQVAQHYNEGKGS